MGTGVDIVSKLLMDDKDYTAKLNKCKKNTTEFQCDLDKLGKEVKGSITSAFTSLGAAVGVAGGAVATFNKVINSSQTTSDAWAATMRSAKNSVDSFFNAIASGDFSAMTMGLTKIAAKAAAAAAALDTLGNAQMSYGYFNTTNQADFAEALVGMKAGDANARATAEAILGDQQEITNELRNKIEDAVKSLMTETNRLTTDDVSIDLLSTVLRTSISAGGKAQQAQWEQEYKDYIHELDAIKERNQTMVSGKYVNGSYIPAKIIQTPEQKRQMEIEQAALTSKYRESIAYNEILVKKSDEWLQEMINIVNAADQADRLLAQMQKRFQSTKSESNDMIEDIVNASSEHIPGALPGMSGIGTGAANVSKPTSIVLRDTNTEMEQTGSVAGNATEAVDALASAMSSLSGVVSDDAGNWLSWAANVMRAVAQAVPAIMTLTSAESAEATANSAAAVSGGAKSVASIPYVGPALAVAAAASIIAAIAAAPKFAEGGVVGGTSFSGDNVLARVNSGEMVLTKEQQNILSGNISNGLNGKVEFIIRGQQLVGVLNNYSKNTSRSI